MTGCWLVCEVECRLSKADGVLIAASLRRNAWSSLRALAQTNKQHRDRIWFPRKAPPSQFSYVAMMAGSVSLVRTATLWPRAFTSHAVSGVSEKGASRDWCVPCLAAADFVEKLKSLALG